MKLLEYKVAWIDDQPGKAEGFSQSIANKLSRVGFSLSVEWVSTADELTEFLTKLRKDSDYDLILVDWKLGQMLTGGATGTSVAHKIRVQNSFSTIIFYSSEEPDTLRQEIASKRIDGVFCVNRTYFVVEAMDVIRASIKKFSSLNAMRGLFLAAVAEFDDAIRSAAIKGYLGLPAEMQQPIKDRLIDGAQQYLIDQTQRLSDLDRSLDLINLIKAIKPGSKQLADCLISILETGEPSPHHSSALTKFRAYEQEVLQPRNDMAHLMEKDKGGRKVLVRGDREWDVSKFDSLRNLLIEHHENIGYINSPLIEQLISHLKAETEKSAAIQ